MDYPELYRWLEVWTRKFARQVDDADDMVQRIMLRICEYGSGPDGRCSYKTWAYQAARREVWNFYKVDWYSGSELDEEMIDSRTPDRIIEARSKLCSVPPILIDQATGYEYTEIAEQYGINVPAVKSRISRRRRQLEKA